MSKKGTTATFKKDTGGVRCEDGVRVVLESGKHYTVVEQPESTRKGVRILVLQDQKATYLGGADGTTQLPCTIRVQVPNDRVTVKD